MTIVIAMLIIFSGSVKILSFPQFIIDVQKYAILPDVIVLPFSILIVLMEFIAGLGFLFNIQTKLLSGMFLLFLLLFTTAICINLLRGENIECGCFGSAFSNEISWWSVIRNLGLGFILYQLFLKNETFQKL